MFFQAEDGIRDLVRSRGLGDVYKRQLDGAVDISVENTQQRTHFSPSAFDAVTLRALPDLSLIHI